jgi:septal ring factor EnvC (AmiA/AmiB activator)
MEITPAVVALVVPFLVFAFGVIRTFFPNKVWEEPFRKHQEKIENMLKEINKDIDMQFEEIEKNISTIKDENKKIEGEHRLTTMTIAERAKRQEEILNEIRASQKEFQQSIEKRFDAMQEQIKRRDEKNEHFHVLMTRHLMGDTSGRRPPE